MPLSPNFLRETNEKEKTLNDLPSQTLICDFPNESIMCSKPDLAERDKDRCQERQITV